MRQPRPLLFEAAPVFEAEPAVLQPKLALDQAQSRAMLRMSLGTSHRLRDVERDSSRRQTLLPPNCFLFRVLRLPVYRPLPACDR